MDPRTRPESALSRRGFLLAGAGALVLAACGNDDDPGAAATSTTASVPVEDQLNLVRFFGDDQVEAGRPQRVAFGLADQSLLAADAAPAVLTLTVLDDAGETVQGPDEVGVRREELFRPYYPLVLEVPERGTYQVRGEADGQQVEAFFMAVGPGDSPVPAVGDPLPALATPTTADALGVDPICTLDPPCPFHEVSLDEALAGGGRVALYVGTPAFCQTAICGPTLELLADRAGEFADVTIVHLEVFTDDGAQTLTDGVQQLGLTFEPTLLVADDTGTITARLDNIFDASELSAALT